MNPCEEFIPLISARLDGELTPEEEARLEAHLAQCPGCRALAADLAVLEATLSPLAQEVPPGLAQSLASQDWTRIPQETPPAAPAQEAPAVKPPRRRKGLWTACAAAAVVLLAVAVGQVALPSNGLEGGDGWSIFSWQENQAPADSDDGRESASQKDASTPQETPPQTEGDTGSQNQGSTSPSDQKTQDPTPPQPPATADPGSQGSTGSAGGSTGSAGGSTGSTPPPGEGADPDLLTQQEAQDFLSAYLAGQGRQLTLVPLGLENDTWVFAGKDSSGQVVSTFSVTRSRQETQIHETPRSAAPSSEGDPDPLPQQEDGA